MSEKEFAYNVFKALLRDNQVETLKALDEDSILYNEIVNKEIQKQLAVLTPPPLVGPLFIDQVFDILTEYINNFK